MPSVRWDPTKAQRNLRKHAVTFEEAESVLRDPLARETVDVDHSIIEPRFSVVGRSILGRILVVIVSTRGQTIRLISARRATKRERDDYERG